MTDWRDEARCKGMDPDIFQPVDAPTCEVIGCSPADLTGTDPQPGAIP